MIFEWLKRLDPEVKGLEDISRKFEQMLEDGRHVFDAAANALLGGTDPQVIREDLFETDQRINRTEQEIRRQLVIHGSVHGSMNLPELLTMMSLAKDAERIGDFGKNIFDLAAQGAVLGGEGVHEHLVDLKHRVSKLLVKSRNVYHKRDEAAAMEFIGESTGIQNECEEALERLLKLEGENAAGSVLCYRYFKRIASHANNIATSLVTSVDKLDFHDEPKI